MRKTMDLTNDNLLKLFIKFFTTSVLGMFMTAICILMDTIFVGRGLGSEALAALNIAIPIYSIFFATGLLFGIGGGAAYSVSLGEGNKKRADKIFTHSVIIGGIISLIYAILGIIFLDELVRVFGATDATISMVKDYLSYLIPVAFSFVMFHLLAAFVRNDKALKYAMIAVSLCGIINIFLDYTFIFIIPMGMRGAALATSIAYSSSAIMLILYFFVKKIEMKIVRCKFEVEILKRIFLNGIPSFILEISSGVIIFMFNLTILKQIGEIGVSAYSIIANLALVAISIFNGVLQGCQPIISVNFGARRIARVRKIRTLGLLSAFVLGNTFFIIGVLNPVLLIHLFINPDEKLLEITTQGMRFYFTAFILMGVNIVLGGYFQAIENNKYSMVISFCRGFLFVSIGVLLLPKIFGEIGIWITVPIAELCTLCVGLLLYFREKAKFSRKV